MQYWDVPLAPTTVCVRHKKKYTDNEPAPPPPPPPTGPSKLRHPSSASSRVLLPPELLEHILIYLSTSELIVAVNASPFFGHCVFHSPRLLRWDPWLLWLCPRKAPLTWYKWTWRELDEHGSPMGGKPSEEETKLVPHANVKTADMEFSCQLAPAQPATLCPLAHLWELTEARLPRGCTADDCTVGINATPNEVELYGDMIFIDPPVYEAHASLFYTHSLHPKSYISGERTVKSDVPLTVRGFLDAAFRMQGVTRVQPMRLEGQVISSGVFGSKSFEEAVSERIRLHGGHFNLVFNRSPVCFKGIRILRSDKWVDEEKKFAEQVREALV